MSSAAQVGRRLDEAALVAEFAKLRSLPEDFEPEVEVRHLASLVRSDLSRMMRDYGDYRAEGAGGSGLVVSAIFEPFGIRRAIKVPRKRIYDNAAAPDSPTKVDPELHALSKLSHEFITRLHHSRQLSENRGHCMVTEYVDHAMPLDQFAKELCCSDSCRRSEAARNEALRELAAVTLKVVRALEYMHSTANLLHFDVKPDNVLVAKDHRPFVTDLGFARDVTRYPKDGDDVDVGFTWKYAHPSLTDPHKGARVSKNPAKAKNTVEPEKLLPRVDVFAFGRTLQEVLRRLEEVYREAIFSHYTFNYLHLIAALCLDGRNAADAGDMHGDFVADQALGLPIPLFKSYKFETFSPVRDALERLLGLRRLEDELPEVDRWAAETIRVSDLGVTTFTPRVRALVSHPRVERLAHELQLGMLDTVFPTATHSRLEHSLGVYHAAGDYISALYYDPENPTFRVLFREANCRLLLLAALLHDVGQTTFGHELEEVDKDEFNHEVIGATILRDAPDKDSKKRRLRDIIEGTGHDCWSLSVDEVVAFLERKSDDPLDGVLRDILDGHIDADKMDYLTRDTVETRVRYGHGLDHERFLRSLTTCSPPGGRAPFLRLAVKRKGAASAEAFAFARYQLYQALYWHHTFRAIKAMVLTAAGESIAAAQDAARDRDLEDVHVFRDAYLEEVMGIGPITARREQARSANRETLRSIVRRRLASEHPRNTQGKYSEDIVLNFLWRLGDGPTRLLIQDVMQRRYYKRVIEIPLSDFREEGWVRLRETFSSDRRMELRKDIEEALLNALRSSIQDQIARRESLMQDKVLATLEDIVQLRMPIVIDLPLRGWTATGDEPLFVSDYKRRHFRRGAGAFDDLQTSTLWSDQVPQMMRRIAVFRVFCEPRLHAILLRVLDEGGVRKAVQQHLPDLRG